jgi:hypothetical protein
MYYESTLQDNINGNIPAFGIFFLLIDHKKGPRGVLFHSILAEDFILAV